jgi:DnaK suppressor protein
MHKRGAACSTAVAPYRGPVTDTASIRQQLLDRLDALRQAISDTADDRKPIELDQQSVGRLSRIDSLQVQAMAQKSGQMKQREIVMIQSALERLESGDFGCCVSCGEAIAPKRLAIDATIPTCIACASGGA